MPDGWGARQLSYYFERVNKGGGGGGKEGRGEDAVGRGRGKIQAFIKGFFSHPQVEGFYRYSFPRFFFELP